VVDVLLHSERAGVLRLLLSYLDDPHPPTAALSAMARRQDLRFIRNVLKKIGFEPSAQTAANLKRLESIPWLQSHFELLDQLDDACQHSAVQMLMASGIKRLEAFKVIEHLALDGTPGGRRAAYEALARFHGLDASALTVRALDDEDPFVQAAGVRQLRQRGVPGALPRLLELLDSRYEVVREAVRESLAEFQFKRFLANYDSLEPATRASTAPLVRKIDPQCLPQLAEEMKSASRTRRLRGIEMAVAMNAPRDVESTLIELLSDEDHMVRAAAARAMEHCTSPASRQALQRSLSDRSPLVQEAARQSLNEQVQEVRFPSLSIGQAAEGASVYE
jgi:HEAT repeat protein